MDFSNYTKTNIADVTALFSVDTAQGLSHKEIIERKKKYGPNRLAENRIRPFHIFLRQFKSAFIYLLLGATILSFFLGELVEGWMIVVFLLINTSLGFYQEYRSEQTVELLKKYVTVRVKVRRNGTISTVDAKDLVPGDLVIIEAGDNIPADIRIIENLDLTVNEEPLTGESVPVKKESAPLTEEANEIYEAKNIGFSGTTVVSGRGAGIVFAIGTRTIMGDIARKASETKRRSLFEEELAKFSKFILYLVVGTLLFIFFANIAIKGWGDGNIATLAIFSIALAVSVVPEALPVVMTFSLSRGARSLAKNNVVVKRLSAIEDLGSIQVLCSDKTGTLTENKLAVCETCNVDKQTLPRTTILYANMGGSYLPQTSRGQSPDPFDTALWESLEGNERAVISEYQRVQDIPFDPIRKKNSVLLEKDGETILVVRGAPESVLASSNITQKEREKILSWMENEGRAGRRVLAVASKKLLSSEYDDERDETNLSFIGCVSFFDSVKQSAYEAIQEAKNLNVAIKILTGDSKDVAGAVAHEVGLAKQPTDVMTAHDFFLLPEGEQEEALKNINVFARVSPEEKYNIIKLLQKNYQVGFLGEGINDAPALKVANVAIVVDSASDIAREVADIILLERSLYSIIKGVREGRSIFANTIKYIRSSLSSNFGNFYAVAVSSLFIPFLPMLPLQILLVNLLSDFPAIAIATDKNDEADLREPRQYNIRKIIIFGTTLGIVSTIFDFITFASFYKISPESLQTHWFMVSILTEILFLFSIRTSKPFWKGARPPLTLLGLSVFACTATLIIPFTTVGHTLFNFTTPTTQSFATVLIIVLAYFIATEIAKLLYYRVSRGLSISTQ